MRANLAISVAAFSIFGLAGPVIQRISLAPASFLILVWPALLLTAGGSADRLQHDFRVASIVNVVLFAVLGLLVAMVGRRPLVIVAAYLAICGMVTMAEAWGAGFSATFFSLKDLAIAFAMYALPFAAIGWSNRRMPEAGR